MMITDFPTLNFVDKVIWFATGQQNVIPLECFSTKSSVIRNVLVHGKY